MYTLPPGCEKKPWGWSLTFASGNGYTGKVLYIKTGECLSLQYHTQKDETVCLIEGRAEIEISGKIYKMLKGKSFWIPANAVHWINCLASAVIVEASTPEIGETIRLRDKYGRGNEILS